MKEFPDLPTSFEELTAFYLRTGKSLFAWLFDNDDREWVRTKWILDNKHWAVDQVELKLGLGKNVREPVMVMRFSSSAICINRVIFVPYRVDWYPEELYIGFGIDYTKRGLTEMLVRHYQEHNKGLVIYERKKVSENN